MKKLIAILLLTLSIGCGSYANDESVIVSKSDNSKNLTGDIYKYKYTIYAEFSDLVIYSNKEYNIGDKINFGEKK